MKRNINNYNEIVLNGIKSVHVKLHNGGMSQHELIIEWEKGKRLFVSVEGTANI